MKLTAEQKSAIRISDKNLIVVAGAGTGKTRVLIERFLQLLQDNPDWRINSLVAITFTREAAFEMRHRLRLELERRARDSGAVPWARHLAQLDSARIDTIHGLCAGLLRANAAQAGVDPKFEVLDENESAILLDDVVSDVLATIEAPLSSLFAHYDSYRIESALRQSNLVNAAFASLPDDPEALFQIWEGEWYHSVFEARRLLLGRRELAAMDSLGALPLDDKLAELIEQYRRYLADAEGTDDATAIVRLLRQCHKDGAVGSKGSAAAWGGKDVKDYVANLLRGLRDQIKDALDTVGGPPADIDRATAEMLPLWYQLLQLVKTTYQERKRDNAQLDFDDLERLAAQLLQHDDVKRRYQMAEFKHVLVDEFQDTNSAQWQIISALADPQRRGALFAVGDPKQSIYQFRGADVSVFNAVRDQIADHEAGLALPLSKSFRSHRPLVEQFNALFKKLLVRDEGSPVKDFEVVFDKDMTAYRSEAPALPAITLQLLDSGILDEQRRAQAVRRKSRANMLREWEAYEIATHIKRMIAEGRPVCDKASSETRRIAYRDIAVLFQSMTKLTLYEDVFKSQAIPFLTVAGRGYFDRQEVWDMLDLLRFLHNPADSLSLATVLRSPIFAFSDDLLFALRLPNDDDSQSPPLLWQALLAAAEMTVPGVAEADLPAIAHARATLERLLKLAGRLTISELLWRALEETNYLAILTGLPDGDRRRGNVEKLVQLAEDSGKITLAKFTRYLEDLSTREAREGEAMLEPGNAIRLMTVHASKGLEFPLVVLADASWERGTRGAPTVFVDAAFGLSCNIYSDESNEYEDGYAHRRNLKLQALREAAERKRLLYVAATRAQDYLLISGSVKQDRSGTWTSRGWLKLLLPALEITAVPREPEQFFPFAGRPLKVLMPPAPPPPGRLLPSPSAAETLWSFDASPADYPPLAPPLMKPLPQISSPRPRHISATQLTHLGAYLHGSNAPERSQFSRRFRDIALTGMTEDDHENAFVPHRNWQRLIGQIAHEVLRYADFSAEAAISDEMIRSIAWDAGLTNSFELRSALQEVHQLLQAYRESEVHHWISNAQAAQRPVYTELPFMLRTESRVIHGVMDVLLRRSNGVWAIIDYKTSKVAGNFAEHAKRFRLQLGIYASAAQEQLALERPPLAFVHYLRGNQTIELSYEDCQRDLIELESTIGELTVSDAPA